MYWDVKGIFSNDRVFTDYLLINNLLSKGDRIEWIRMDYINKNKKIVIIIYTEKIKSGVELIISLYIFFDLFINGTLFLNPHDEDITYPLLFGESVLHV